MINSNGPDKHELKSKGHESLNLHVEVNRLVSRVSSDPDNSLSEVEISYFFTPPMRNQSLTLLIGKKKRLSEEINCLKKQLISLSDSKKASKKDRAALKITTEIASLRDELKEIDKKLTINEKRIRGKKIKDGFVSTYISKVRNNNLLDSYEIGGYYRANNKWDHLSDAQQDANLQFLRTLRKFCKDKVPGEIGPKDIEGKDKPKTIFFYVKTFCYDELNYIFQDMNKPENNSQKYYPNSPSSIDVCMTTEEEIPNQIIEKKELETEIYENHIKSIENETLQKYCMARLKEVEKSKIQSILQVEIERLDNKLLQSYLTRRNQNYTEDLNIEFEDKVKIFERVYKRLVSSAKKEIKKEFSNMEKKNVI